MMKLTIIIPVFNEIQSLKILLNKVLGTKINKQIIVVDDFSSDGSRELLINQFKDKINKLILHKKNLGKGAAIISAKNYINGDYIIIQDADLEYDPFDYNKLLVPFFDANADIVYGSRFLGGGKYVRIHFFWHFLANKILTFICNFVTNLNLTDMETGYKVFKKNILLSLDLKENSFGIEPELTIKLSKKNAKFFEVPISYNGRSYAEGKKITIKDAFRALFCIFRYSIFK